MGKMVMTAAVTWSLIRAGDTWFNDSRFTDTALLIAQQVRRSFGWF